MNHDLNLGATVLAKGQLQSLRDARGVRVFCLSGSLWLTLEGDIRDIVLQTGEEAVIDRDGLSILTALHDSRFVLLPPPAPPHLPRQQTHAELQRTGLNANLRLLAML